MYHKLSFSDFIVGFVTIICSPTPRGLEDFINALRVVSINWLAAWRMFSLEQFSSSFTIVRVFVRQSIAKVLLKVQQNGEVCQPEAIN